MIKIRETIHIGNWIITLVAVKPKRGAYWTVSAIEIRSPHRVRPDWHSDEGYITGVRAIAAGKVWALAEFG